MAGRHCLPWYLTYDRPLSHKYRYVGRHRGEYDWNEHRYWACEPSWSPSRSVSVIVGGDNLVIDEALSILPPWLWRNLE